MAQISAFLVVSREDDLIVACETLEAAMRDVADFLTDKKMHSQFPISVVLEDDNGTETKVCTVQLP